MLDPDIIGADIQAPIGLASVLLLCRMQRQHELEELRTVTDYDCWEQRPVAQVSHKCEWEAQQPQDNEGPGRNNTFSGV